MKGVILAGGTGSRLYPLTKVTNKHLLPVYNKPMIFYPLEKFIEAGIKDILIVSGPEHSGHFLQLLGSGKNFGVRFHYEIQEEAGGIAQALSLAEIFANGENLAVILGDNIFEDNFSSVIQNFKQGAHVFLKKVTNAKRFGVAEVQNTKVLSIEEKPQKPKSNLAITGCYLYDNQIFDIIRTLKPSWRNELEITDVNNYYIRKEQLQASFLNGYWSDAGTFDSLFRSGQFIKTQSERQSGEKN